MDFVKKLSGGSHAQGQPQQQQQGGFMGSVNNAMGGGAHGERNEDFVDKGVDMFQERVLHQGAQNNESAFEQAKDERISDAIRSGYHSVTGKDVPVKDKS